MLQKWRILLRRVHSMTTCCICGHLSPPSMHHTRMEAGQRLWMPVDFHWVLAETVLCYCAGCAWM